MDSRDEPVVSTASGPELYDPETRLLSPQAWSAILAVESSRCKRYGRPATIVMVEVTGLEDLAAVWGSDVGSHAAARVGAVLRARCRHSDYAARIGPRRFAVLLSETDEIAAVNFVERVREACDEALRATQSGARAFFGWADATKDRTLAAAADAATERVSADRRAEGAR